MLPFICEESAEGHTMLGEARQVCLDTLVPSALRYDEGKEQLVDTLVAARLRCDEGSRTEAVQ